MDYDNLPSESMRLVYRPAHTAFKHRHRLANALNIKSTALNTQPVLHH
ncbi:MAG: hypothetical protein K2H38_10075 [Muribaculaceae bacterium]|nr:hypothetical protein [Muribaculaceae bacterium]